MVKQVLERKDIKLEDTWNLQDYFADDECWRQSYEQLSDQINRYDKYRGHLAESARTLYECLTFDDELCELLERVYCYAHQKQDQDTQVAKYQEAYGMAEDLYTKIQTASAFIRVEITRMGREKLEQMMEELPELIHYRRVFDLILNQASHTLNGDEERLLAESNYMAGGAAETFKMFNNADLEFAPIENENGELMPVTHGTYISYMENPSQQIRRAAYESLYTAYGAYRNTLAAMFQARLKEHTFYARARKYDSPLQYSLFNNEIPLEVYDRLIEAIHQALPEMHRYVKLRKKVLRLDEIHMYDIYTPLMQGSSRSYTFEEAKALVKEGLKPMGEEYLGLLSEGFENRWIDVYENKGKRSGAYSTSSYSVHPYVLLNFNGSLDHVFTLAHEMGHALHSWYSNHNQPYAYASYKIFVAEVASTCNEALLNHYLLEKASDPQEKALIINKFLESFRGTIFRQTMFAEFEKITHEMVWKGETLTADKLCDIYHKLNEQYFGPDMIVDSLIDMEWARIPHFYTPFYVYQYATGFTAAIALSARILEKGETAVQEYLQFLKGGCSTDPISLLKMAGVDMTSDEPVQSAVAVFGGMLDQLEVLCSKK